jgi:phage replication-related protein YjqB (UPF0714/DUF867 family)
MVADTDINFYLFEGIKPNRNRVLHITSSHFDEVTCLRLLEKADTVVAIHGCGGPHTRICVGGLDRPLREMLCSELRSEGLPVVADDHEFSATNPMNICNRGARQRGAQIEVSRDLRTAVYIPFISAAIRRAMTEHARSLE